MSDKTRPIMDAGARPEDLPPTLEETQARNAEMRLQKMAKLRQQRLSDSSLVADRNDKLVP